MGNRDQFLVTGGTGFIGRFVVRQLLRQAVPVRLFCRDEAKARRLFGNQVDVVPGDLRDPTACARACRGVYAAIHVGGVYRFGRRQRAELAATNADGTETLLQAAWNNRLTRFVNVSSASVLAEAAPVTEAEFPANVPPRQAYRHSKWLGECRALEFARRGLPVVIVNPTVPLGAEDETPTPSGQMVMDFLRGRFPFSTRTSLNIVHVADLAVGICAAAERGRAGERYLLGHHNVSLSEFLQVLAERTGKPAPKVCLPWLVVAAAGLLGEVTGSGRVCWETASHARHRTGYSCQKAASELAWQPNRPLAQTVDESISWFRQRLESAGASPGLSVRPAVACQTASHGA